MILNYSASHSTELIPIEIEEIRDLELTKSQTIIKGENGYFIVEKKELRNLFHLDLMK
ncbi:hypothetical protein [Virgibacillus salexigens]|uniref:hypothetical protein n=1 Tax=Virgibacillus salexigens TaxID=61016 RepID=UPI0019094AE6|nr:hypothetical protein [Virgibacillus salexigens]